MKLLLRLSFTLLASALLFGCTKDFIVKDIKNKTLTLIAPADNINTPSNSVIFWWDELDGAEKYNLQIVSPSFNAVSQLVVDTNITGNKFSHTFTPGTYQWRIKAVNAGGSTAYITRSFVIDTTSNLAYLSVSPIAPANQLVTKIKTINFSWNALTAATYYDLTITNLTTGSITAVSNITTTNYSNVFTTTTDAVYSWQVKAFNTSSQTNPHPARTFKIDVTSPGSPSISYPNQYGQQRKDTTRLTWFRNAANTDIHYDIISLSNDTNFTTVLGVSSMAYSVSPIPINAIYSYSSTPMKVWWRVSSVDTAGNTSSYVQSKGFYLY